MLFVVARVLFREKGVTLGGNMPRLAALVALSGFC